jgi:hypothetical protein
VSERDGPKPATGMQVTAEASSGQLAGKSRASEKRAACDGKKRRLEEREVAGALADKNREEKAKRDAEQHQADLTAGALADKNRKEKAAKAEQRPKPDVAAKEAEALRQQRIAENKKREEEVCVAFCLQCTGAFGPLAARVCPDLYSAAAGDSPAPRFVLQAAAKKADKEALRQQWIAENKKREEEVCVAFWHWHLPCSRGACVS